MFKSELMPKGAVTIEVLKDGNVVKKFTDHNLVVVNGRKLIALAIAGFNDTSKIEKMKVGSGTGGTATAPVDSNIALEDSAPLSSDIGSADISYNPSQTEVTFKKNFALTTAGATKTICEAGLFYIMSNNDVLFSRYTFPPMQISANDNISINVIWTISVPAKNN